MLTVCIISSILIAIICLILASLADCMDAPRKYEWKE